MLKLLCYLTMFSTIVNPVHVLPWLTERAYLVLASVTLMLFAAHRLMNGLPLSKLPQRKYVYAIIITYTLSIAQTGWLGGTFDAFLYWVKVALVFTVIVDMHESPRDIRRSLFTVVAAVAVLTVIGWNLYLNDRVSTPGRLESVGDYNLSNSFALALTTGSAFAFALMDARRGFTRKMLYLALLTTFAITSLYTRSRGGNLGLAVAVMVSVVLSRRVKSQALKLVMVSALVGAMAISVPIILTRPDSGISYFGGDSSADDRVMVWQASLRMIRANPLFGVGFGQFREHVRSYGSDKKLVAHNTLLSVTAETGIAGGLLFVMIIVATLAALWKVWRQSLRDPDQEEFACLVQGVFVGLVAFLVNSSFSSKDTDPLLWVMLGIAGGTVVVHRRLVARAPTPAESPTALDTVFVSGGQPETPRADCDARDARVSLGQTASDAVIDVGRRRR